VRRPGFDVVQAVLEALVGVGVAAWFLGIWVFTQPADGRPRRAIDHAFLGLVTLAFAGLAWWSVRRARVARTAWAASAVAPPTAADVATPPEHRPPPLSEENEQVVADIVGALQTAGVLPAGQPDPSDLYEAVADAVDHGAGHLGVSDVLTALYEAHFHHPDLDPEAWWANLAFHESHVEQTGAELSEQIADLARLVGGGTAVALREIEQRFEAEGADRDRTRLTVAVGRDELVLDYAGAPKHLSTELHVALAQALESAGGQAVRLAWLWSDQGVWVTGLPPEALRPLNAALVSTSGSDEVWSWVTDREPRR
jgi:hypothetical protein